MVEQFVLLRTHFWFIIFSWFAYKICLFPWKHFCVVDTCFFLDILDRFCWRGEGGGARGVAVAYASVQQNSELEFYLWW